MTVVDILTSRLHEDFLGELNRLNAEKRDDAPRALVLIAEEDRCHSFDDTSRFFILTLAKTHRVFTKILFTQGDIRSCIQDTKPVHVLAFLAHGSTRSIFLSPDKTYRSADVRQQDFEGLVPQAQIFFVSCEVAGDLAQTVAKISNCFVFASFSDINLRQVSITFCDRHQMLEMRHYPHDSQEIFRFYQDQMIRCDTTQSEDHAYFDEMREYIIAQVKSGQVADQFILGMLYQDQKNNPLAKLWLKKAAKRGYASAQYELGYLFEQEKKMKPARFFYRKAATKGHTKAQYSLARLYHHECQYKISQIWLDRATEKNLPTAQYVKGKICLANDQLDEAEIWLFRSAKQKYAPAQYYLSQLYQKINIPSLAKFWLDRAKSQGYTEKII